MRLQPREIIDTCSEHYNNWKSEALKTNDPVKMKRLLEKAFFWLELQSNLLILWTVENTLGYDPSIKEKVDMARLNINKKIAEYASSVLEELK